MGSWLNIYKKQQDRDENRAMPLLEN